VKTGLYAYFKEKTNKIHKIPKCFTCSNDFVLSSLLVPCPNLYGQLNALQFTLDERSILWLNQFVLDLKQSLIQFMAMYKLNDNSKSDEHVDVRVDGLMLKV